MINANAFWLPCIVFLTILTGLVFIRAIRGPRIADRIMGVNLIGTISLACIAILAVYLKQSWLVDVSLIYAMLSFLTVVVLCQVHLASKGKEDDPDD